MRHASSSAAKSPWNASGASDRAASTAKARAVFESTSAQRGESTASLRRGASFVVLSQKSAYLFGGESADRVRRQDMFLLHLGSGSSTVPRWEAVVYGDLLTVPPARTEHTATVVPGRCFGPSSASEPLPRLTFAFRLAADAQ